MKFLAMLISANYLIMPFRRGFIAFERRLHNA